MPDRSQTLRSKLLLTRIRPGSVSTGLVVLAGLVFAALVGVADWLAGADLSPAIFYVLPVVAVTWLTRVSLGVAVAAAVSIESLVIAEHHPGPMSGGMWAWYVVVPFAFYLVVIWLVAGLRQLLDDHERQADIDVLTGVLSRRAFYDRVEIELARARRQDGPVAFVYLDVDGLKEVNDTISHAAGDDLLRRFVRLTAHSLRATDLFGRIGGDEFAILLAGATRSQAESVADRILDELHNGPGVSSTASIGIVACVHAPEQLDGVVRLADQLMYVAKRDGGGVVRATEFDPHPTIDLRPPEPTVPVRSASPNGPVTGDVELTDGPGGSPPH
jgi:diguanylate cyclase (GGDEF)-like protein